MRYALKRAERKENVQWTFLANEPAGGWDKRQKSVPTNRKYIRGITMRMSIHSNTKSKTVF